MRVFLFLVLTTLLMLPVPTARAIELQPTDEQIAAVIQAGATDGSGSEIMNRFGSTDACGWGFVQTRLQNIWASSQTAARKLQSYTRDDAAEWLDEKEMMITYVLCADSQKDNAHLVIEQHSKVVQPSGVITTSAGTSPTWPRSPAYMTIVQARFRYQDLDPAAETTIIIVPSVGPRSTHTVSFSELQ